MINYIQLLSSCSSALKDFLGVRLIQMYHINSPLADRYIAL